MSDDERLDRALEALRAGRSPRSEAAGLEPDEQRMLRFAQMLRGSAGDEPDAEFVESLHGRLFPDRRRVSRRSAFLGGLGAMAAGVLGGLGLDRLVTRGPKPTVETALVGKNGRWIAAARADDLPHGAIKAFTAGHVQGFLINTRGDIRAISRICTHMGCRLDFERDEQALVCPCHGAEFALSGEARYGPGGYGIPLPPLPRIATRQKDGVIEVWSV